MAKAFEKQVFWKDVVEYDLKLVTHNEIKFI